MHPGNTFNARRFAFLFKQNMIHHSRFFLQSLVAFSGGIFILLSIIQISNSFRTPSPAFYINVFLIVFTATGIICTGTAFPALRNKVTSLNFFMIPASIQEKFLVEIVARLILFILIVPLVYWIVYNVEGYLANLFFPKFLFEGQPLLQIPQLHMPTETASERTYILVPLAIVLMFVIPFTGATIFEKSPLIKTLFAVAVIFFFNLFLVYFFIEILDFEQYYPTTPILFLRHLEDALLASIIAGVIFIAGFMATAFLKLKEREI